MITTPPVRTQRGRRAWVAIVLSLLSPLLAMMCLGRGWRALLYFAAALIAPVAVVALASNGHWIGGVSPISASLLVALVAIVDSWRIALGLPDGFSGPWYSRWPAIAGVAAGALLCAFCLRGFGFETYRIPSSGMIPGLRIGDYILVQKWQYGVRMPFTHNMMVELGLPQRGDVVAFRFPLEPSDNYVKRIVGLPGDQIQYVDRTLVINGQPVEKQPQKPFFNPSTFQQFLQFEEHLGTASYLVIYADGASSPVVPDARNTDKQACSYVRGGVLCSVPLQSYFVLGDNRDYNKDSRHWGFVPARNIVGRVSMIWWSESSPGRAWTPVQ